MLIFNSTWRKKLFQDKPFFTTLFAIMIPIALQNLLVSGLNFADTLMIGQLGETEVAAVGLANQIFFLLILNLFGFGSASAIFVSQYWGKGDIPAIRRTQGLSLVLGLFPAALFTFAALAVPEWTMGIFSKDPEVIRLGSDYLRVVGLSYPLVAVSFGYANILRSIEKAALPLYASILALGTNVVLNYLFIFGIGPFPALGVVGAALGTTLSRVLETLFLFYLVYRKPRPGEGENPSAATLREMGSFSLPYLKKYLMVASPVVANEITWALGMTVYKIIYARMGTDAIAAVNIAEVIINLMFVLFLGSGNAAAVMVGKVIGGGEKEKAYEYALRFSFLGIIMGLGVGLLMMLLSVPVVHVFSVSPAVKEAVRWILVIVGFTVPFKVFNLHIVVGVLRGGGDTRASLYIDLFGVWLIGVPMALAGGIWLGLAVPVVYAMAVSEEIFKSILCFYRLVSKKWINDLTEPPPEIRYIQEWD